MKGKGHKYGKSGVKKDGGVPTPKASMPSSSQGGTFDPQGGAAKGTHGDAYEGTNGS